MKRFSFKLFLCFTFHTLFSCSRKDAALYIGLRISSEHFRLKSGCWHPTAYRIGTGSPFEQRWQVLEFVSTVSLTIIYHLRCDTGINKVFLKIHSCIQTSNVYFIMSQYLLTVRPLCHLLVPKTRRHNIHYDDFRWYHFLKWPHNSYDLTYILFLISFQNMTWFVFLWKGTLNPIIICFSIFSSDAFLKHYDQGK